MATPSPTTALQNEHATMTVLLDLLKQEQEYLVSADTEALEQATPAKTDMVRQMAAATSERHQALSAAGFPGSDKGMESWLAANGDERAASLWNALIELTREAKEQNRVNGMLIARHLAHNQNLLNAMRQPASGPESAVYGPSGQAPSTGPSRRFVLG
ncbi:MAG TPA: flagellar protein FlgN [Telluria sp.]|nr:flagellar protein FlgN [Telluria sp.]